MKKTSFIWQPADILNAEVQSSLYACVLLNRPILFEKTIFQQLWNNATIRVLVDGGANRWFKFIEENDLKDAIEEPSCVCGDMDSISQESIERLTNMNIEFIHTPDQDDTDLTKALMVSKPFIDNHGIANTLILTDFSGRIDQLMSQINALFKCRMDEVYLLSENTLAWILRPGIHCIAIPEQLVEEQMWCSYIPIGSVCRVTTQGLKYDLTNESVCFGGVISTSNTYASTAVKIECDHTLFWAMGTAKD